MKTKYLQTLEVNHSTPFPTDWKKGNLFLGYRRSIYGVVTNLAIEELCDIKLLEYFEVL